MRYNVKLFVRIVSEIFDPPEPIFEIGSLQVSGQEGFADLRPFFQGKIYVGCDACSGLGVDRIENVEKLSMNNETVGTILMVDTLEHVENPYKALDEIYRVLMKNGMVIMTSVMNFPIHDYPADFWRFTPEAFVLLLKKFPTKIIGNQGLSRNPHTVSGIGFKSENVNDAEIIAMLEDLHHHFSKGLSKIQKKETMKMKIFRKIAQKRFPHLFNPIYSKEFKTVSFDYFRGKRCVKSFRTRI